MLSVVTAKPFGCSSTPMVSVTGTKRPPFIPEHATAQQRHRACTAWLGQASIAFEDVHPTTLKGVTVRFKAHSYRHGIELLETVTEYEPYWSELLGVVGGLTDQRIAEAFRANGEGRAKSISHVINTLIDEDLVALGWVPQSPIFAVSEYGDRTWRLDFAKGPISVEVGFNHGGNISWNLIKPVIASEINHVAKAAQTSVGVVIAATEALKVNGGFDSAVGSFEKYISHLLPLRSMLTVPMAIIGLEPCESFSIRHEMDGRNRRGFIEWSEGCEPLIPEANAEAPSSLLEELD